MTTTEHAPHCANPAMNPYPTFVRGFQLHRCTTCGATTLKRIETTP